MVHFFYSATIDMLDIMSIIHEIRIRLGKTIIVFVSFNMVITNIDLFIETYLITLNC